MIGASACIMSNIQSYSHWISCVHWPSLFKWSMFSIVQNFILWSCSLLTQLVDDECDVDTILTEESFVRYFFPIKQFWFLLCWFSLSEAWFLRKRVQTHWTMLWHNRLSSPIQSPLPCFDALWWPVTFDFRFDRTHLRPDPLELLSTVLLTLSSQSHFQVSLPKLRVVYFDFFLSVPFPTARWVTSTVSALTEQPNLSSINVSSRLLSGVPEHFRSWLHYRHAATIVNANVSLKDAYMLYPMSDYEKRKFASRQTTRELQVPRSCRTLH